jgi:hypothetical protein
MKKTVWAGVIFAVLVVGFVMYSSFRGHPYTCQVCMSFHGARDCRTASADTRENALRTAITNACAQLASGVTESSQCEGTTPASVEWK